MLHFEEVTNLRTNSSPQITLAKFVVLIDWLKSHATRIVPLPRGRCVNILGRPVDQLRTQAIGTPDTEIVKGGLELGDIVGRGPDGRNAVGGVILPETVRDGVVG